MTFWAIIVTTQWVQQVFMLFLKFMIFTLTPVDAFAWYSSDMLSLLNRGLNFAITPFKLNVTELLVNFARFERSCMWVEYWANKKDDEEDVNDYNAPLFKKQKSNLPKNPSRELKTCLGAIKSEIRDPQNRNQVRPKSKITSSLKQTQQKGKGRHA